MSDYKIRVEVGSDYSLAVETAKINNNLDDLKIKIADKKKEKGKNILTFSDGSQIIIEDGASPYISEDGYWHIGGQSTGVKARAELSFKELTPSEKAELKGEKGDTLKFSDLSQSQKEELRGKQGYTGESSKIIKTEYDSAGNTVLTFNDGTKTTVSKGSTGDKGNPGDSVSVASVTKSGTTNTVKFTDGKSMQVEDGRSVNVSSTRILDDGNTEITFTDGKKAIVKKGQDGTVKFDDLTEEQRKSLQVDVVDDLTTGGSDKALSAEQGKVLVGEIKKLRDNAFSPKIMTAVIDQANSNPLTCITYEDDAKMMEKGSPEWDKFFRSQLVLFKDGKEIRELADSELNDLKPEDGDVMVRFPRKGLRIKTVGEKVYVSMTNAPDNPDFKYYAHSRGDSPRDAFYLGAYLGYEEDGKLRSITNVKPTDNINLWDSEKIARKNGTGYNVLAFYQWTFLQAMYVLKYGNLNVKNSFGDIISIFNIGQSKPTGITNGKGVDYYVKSDYRMKFQHLEDLVGNIYENVDGIKIDYDFKIVTNTNVNDSSSKRIVGVTAMGDRLYVKKVFGTSELGFFPNVGGGSESTYYCSYSNISKGNAVMSKGDTFFNYYFTGSDNSSIYSPRGARLMFL